MRHGQLQRCLRALLRYLPFAAEQVKNAGQTESEGLAVGVRQLVAQCQGFAAATEGFIGVTQIPQNPGGRTQADHPGIMAVD